MKKLNTDAMKRILPLLVVIVILMCNTTLAQYYIVAEKTVRMDKQSVNAWVIPLQDESGDVLKKSLIKYGRKQWGVKFKKKGRDILEAQEVVIPGISSQQGDLKVMFYTESSETTVAVAFMPGGGEALNSQDNQKEMGNLCKSVQQFVKRYKMDQYQEQLANHERRKKALETAYERHEGEQQKVQRHLNRVEKKLRSGNTDEHQVADLTNQQIAANASLEALELIMHNQKGEIIIEYQAIRAIKRAMSQLEFLFAKPDRLEEIQ